MRCQIARASLEDLLEERLPPGPVEELLAHLEACSGCAAAYENMCRLYKLLAGFAPAEAVPDLEQPIMARLEGMVQLPKGLMLLFIFACLAAFYGFFVWVDEQGAGRGLASAYLWVVAGGVSVLSIWLAVLHKRQAENIITIQEERESALTL